MEILKITVDGKQANLWKEEYEKLLEKLKEYENEISSLKEKNEELLDEIEEISRDYARLEWKYDDLKSDYDELLEEEFEEED